MKNLRVAIATTFSIALLIAALVLGFVASWGQTDRNLHAAVALLSGIVAIGMHVRGRSGFDLLATLLLIVALGLGVMLSGGGVASATHLWAAIVAVIASAGAQIRNSVIGDVETARIPEERESLPEKSPLPQIAGSRHWKIWLRLGIVFIIASTIVALLAFGFTRDPRALGPSPILGKEAPPFSLRLFDGSALDLADLKGKIVFLNFWASWCPPCRAEARMLEAGWRRYKDQSVVFVGVNVFDRERDARDFISEFGITYPNGWDLKNKLAADYGVWGLPETFLINREGLVIYKHVGAIGWERLVTKLDEVLEGIASVEEGRGEYRSLR